VSAGCAFDHASETTVHAVGPCLYTSLPSMLPTGDTRAYRRYAGVTTMDEPPRYARSIMGVVPVTEIPFAHNPSKCTHIEHFRQLKAPGRVPDGVAGAEWYLTLTSRDFAACGYHKGNWRRIAAASVEILKAAHRDAWPSDLTAAAWSWSGLARHEREALASLFVEPICWIPPDSPEVVNGQHRLCALRAARAPYVAVETDGYPPPSLKYADAREAAHAFLAAYEIDDA